MSTFMNRELDTPRFQIGDPVVNRLTGSRGVVKTVRIITNYYRNPIKDEFAYVAEFKYSILKGKEETYQALLYDDYAMSPEDYEKYLKEKGKSLDDQSKSESNF